MIINIILHMRCKCLLDVQQIDMRLCLDFKIACDSI